MKGSISVLIAISRLQPVFKLKMFTVDKTILYDFDESVIVQYFQTVSLLRRKMKYDLSLQINKDVFEMKHKGCFQMQLFLQKMFIRTNGVTGNIMTVWPALMNLTKVTAI
ncbi:unnamed protein product [Schistosoma mattheei]|uniref:Uncharacterized protein n=1 Tax=Schistosoma mattheei TaxID=31246 RepID=A0AA85BZ67_9TREM|nr:unnamed protein product [Schistosoma mattheei]